MSESIGEKIKSLRSDKGFTQKKLSTLTGIPEISIRKYEKGQRNPKLDAIEKIAAALEVPANKLLGNDEIEKIKFKDDFDINVFDTVTVKYINNLKQMLKNTFPNVEINNTFVVQNILIKVIANEHAKSAAGMNRNELHPEFNVIDDKFTTGKPLYDMLYNNYLQEYKRESRNLLEKRVNFIILYRINDDCHLSDNEIRDLKEFYINHDENNIPPKVLEILNKEKLKEAEKQLEALKAKGEKIKEMLEIDDNK